MSIKIIMILCMIAGILGASCIKCDDGVIKKQEELIKAQREYIKALEKGSEIKDRYIKTLKEYIKTLEEAQGFPLVIQEERTK